MNKGKKDHTHESSSEDVNGNGVTIKEKSPMEKELENLTNLLASLNNPQHRNNNGFIMPEMEMQLLEKKSWCLLKLKKYERVIEECYRNIGKKGPSAVVYKCLIVALCRTGKYDDVRETLTQWGKLCPKDPVVSASKEKVERLLSAVRSGLNPSEVFVNLEQVLGMASESTWKHRAPPKVPSNFYTMCSRGGQDCVLGDSCTAAHSPNELAEWKLRHELRHRTWEKLRNGPKLSSSAQYLFDITKKIQETTNIRSLLADELPNVKWKCIEPLKITTTQRGLDMKWSMLVGSKVPVRTVALLHDKNRHNFWISAAYYHSVKCNTDINLFMIHEVNRTPWVQVANTFVPSQIFLGQLGGWPDWFYYKLELSFNSHVCGSFRQTVMFDLKSDPKLVKHLSVELLPDTPEPPPFNLETFSEDLRLSRNPPSINWSNLDLVDSESGVRVDVGFQKSTFKLPFGEKLLFGELTRDNYLAAMTQFIELEHKARQEELSKYNITGNLELTSSYTIDRNYESLLKCAWQGQLYAKLDLGQEITEDTSLGRLITTSCQNVLLVEVAAAVNLGGGGGMKPRGYVCKIAEKMKSNIMISVGTKAVQELRLEAGTSRSFIVHFLLDDRNFGEMRRVLQSVGDTQLDILFPDMITLDVDLSRIIGNSMGLIFEGDYTLNERQLQAYNTVTSMEERAMPPLLLIGPFGTGKTYTLAQCLKKILATSIGPKSPRILICTHSNSAADLYILSFLHHWYQEGMKSARPLRIYYADRLVHTVSPTVRKYCLMTDDKQSFRYPSKEEVFAHQIIIVTLSTAAELLALGLERDTFTHILLDEAAQALETEAIQPLVLAGPLTKIVLAGDHMQLSPELFSTLTKGRAVSLLERLNNLYPKNNKCRIVLTENYRSHEAILKFASEAFYEGQLRCASLQPCHPSFFPISFFAVQGDDVLPDSGASFYNMAEVLQVTERIMELVKTWPEQWGNYKAEGSIAVLTPYAGQVTRIRHHLRSHNLGFVSVERVLNVQGKQFRVVLASTVRTQKPGIVLDENMDLGFLSSPKLLNTALTRAQSLFAVVGDPLSLCTVGHCRNLWSDLVAIATARNSFFGMNPADVKQHLVTQEMKHIFGSVAPSRRKIDIPQQQQQQLGMRATIPSPLHSHSAGSSTPNPHLNQSLQHEAIGPNLRSTMAQLDLTQELPTTEPLSTHPSNVVAVEESAEEKELAHVLDKLLYPQVASIWSNNDAAGSPAKGPTPVKGNNIWAPIDNNEMSHDASSSTTPNFSSYSSPLLRDAVGHDLNASKEALNSCSSPDIFRDNLSTPTRETSCGPLGEKLNNPQSFNLLPKESRLRQIMAMNSPVHKATNESPFGLDSMGQLSSSVRHETPNLFGPVPSSPVAPIGVGWQQQQQHHHLQQQQQHHGLFPGLENYHHQQHPQNFRPNLPFAQAVGNPFGMGFHGGTAAVGFPPQPALRGMFNNNISNGLPRPMMHHSQSSYPAHPPFYNHHQATFPAQAFIRNASPVASLSSSDSSSEPINSNDFPTLAETTTSKGKAGKAAQQSAKQLKQNKKSSGEQQQQQQQQNGIENPTTNGSNSNGTTNNNNNNSDEWVQVRKKKAKVKDSTPIPSGEEKIELLISMGFEKKKAIRALQNTNRNLPEAINWLLDKQNGESH